MLAIKKWVRSRLKRRKLNWLSIYDVLSVRDRFLTLYLNPGEKIRAASPRHIFGTGYVDISFGGWTQFDFEYNPVGARVRLSVLLKFDKKDLMPYWDVIAGQRIDTIVVGDETKEVESRVEGAFDWGDYPPLKVIEHLIKAYAYHFPFAPTDNHLVKGGQFVA